MSIERYRLLAAAERTDSLTTMHDNSKIFASVEEFSKLPDALYTITLYTIFNKRKTNEDHFTPLYSLKSAFEEYFGCDVHEDYPIKRGETYDRNIVAMRIQKKIRPYEKEVIKKVLAILTNQNHFHYSVQFCFFAEKEGNIPFFLTTGKTEYFRWILKRRKPERFISVEDVSYRGRETYENSLDKQLLKSILIWFFNEYYGARKCLFKDSAMGKVAFDRLCPPAKQDHLHWRMKINEEYSEFLADSETIFPTLVDQEDAFAFYPAVQKEFEFDDKKINVKHKIVREYDPAPILPQSIVAKISDAAHEVYKEFGIPTIYLHSGSRSARDQCFVDVISLLKEIENIEKEFPFIGVTTKEEAKNIEDRYHRIIRAYERATDLFLIEKLFEKDLLFQKIYGKKAPSITFDKGSELRPVSILVDTPDAVSIGIGSPKKRLVIDEKTKDILQESVPRKELLDLLHSIFLICTPIDTCPKTKEETINKCNMLTGGEYFNKNYQQILKEMDKKLVPNTIRKCFENIQENERMKKKFDDLCKLREEIFLKESYLKFL
jgi:hypothetical protein